MINKKTKMIDVWKIEYDGTYYFDRNEPDPLDFEEGTVFTKEEMKEEIFENLPVFTGF